MRRFAFVLLTSLLVLGAMPLIASAEPFEPPEGDPRRAVVERFGQPADLPVEARFGEGVQEKLQEAAEGRVRVIVRLTEPSLSETFAAGRRGSQQAQQQERVESQQDGVLRRARQRDPDLREAGRVKSALNALILHTDVRELPALAEDPDVARIDIARVYERRLETTVPQIGADLVQAAGITGDGVRVAVLDSGVDYTHAAMGGPGARGAWCRAYGCDADGDPVPAHPRNRQRADGAGPYFPTDKVVGGFDYIGELWPGEDSDPDLLNPDPNPIDVEGHGTHVADIIGGMTEGGAPGVAPGVDIVAVRVCASFASSCEGGAILQGIDFAMNPEDDPDFEGASDIINMSLGLDYGTSVGDPIADAVENVTDFGILTVAAAGNSGDHPYVSGTPAGIPSALSVAWTTRTDDAIHVGLLRTEPEHDFSMVYQDWSGRYDRIIEETVVYGDTLDKQLGCGADTVSNPWADGELVGDIVLVDRGRCFFSRKVINASEAGAEAVLIAQNTPDPPFVGSVGDDLTGLDLPPAFMIFLSDGDAIRAAIAADPAARVHLDPGDATPTPDSMVTASSRGPSFQNRVKPEIGAPGAAVSAEAGTGTGRQRFGGTSGATPHVAGSAALLLEEHGELEPHELKALLMNTAERDIFLTPLEHAFIDSDPDDHDLAPISRIGAGEVRANQAFESPAAAWDAEDPNAGAALSFGFADVTEADLTLTKPVTVHNYSTDEITYTIENDFRYKRYSGRVSVTTPSDVTVPAEGDASFDATLTIDHTALPLWELDSFFFGDSGPLLSDMEVGGHIVLASGDSGLALPWHVLPRLSGDTSADDDTLSFDSVGATDSVTLTNDGVGPTFVDDYDLLGQVDERSPSDGTFGGSPAIDLRAVGLRQFALPEDEVLLAFAANLWDRVSHANLPGGVLFGLDINADGAPDRFVFNGPGSLLIAGGPHINLTFVADAQFNLLAAFGVQHPTNSTNLTLFATSDALGVEPGDTVTGFAATIAFSDRFYPGGEIDDIEFTVGANVFLPAAPADVDPGDTNEAGFSWTGHTGSTEGVLLFLTGQREVAPDTFVSSGAPLDGESIVLDAEFPERVLEQIDVTPDDAVPVATGRRT